jgi:hypothetical protein
MGIHGGDLVLRARRSYAAGGNEEWSRERLANGFHYFQLDNWYRLARLLYPDELLSKTTLEDQRQALAEWILKAFEELDAYPPPV